MWFFRRKKPVNSLPDRDEHLTGYIFNYYFHLLTTDEQNAWLSMVREEKARSSRGILIAKTFTDDVQFAEAKRAMDDELAEVLEKRNSNPRVKSLLANGPDEFMQSTCDRILRKHFKKIYFNLCPKCKALAKTPTAKQCRKCFYSWHEM